MLFVVFHDLQYDDEYKTILTAEEDLKATKQQGRYTAIGSIWTIR